MYGIKDITQKNGENEETHKYVAVALAAELTTMKTFSEFFLHQPKTRRKIFLSLTSHRV